MPRSKTPPRESFNTAAGVTNGERHDVESSDLSVDPTSDFTTMMYWQANPPPGIAWLGELGDPPVLLRPSSANGKWYLDPSLLNQFPGSKQLPSLRVSHNAHAEVVQNRRSRKRGDRRRWRRSDRVYRVQLARPIGQRLASGVAQGAPQPALADPLDAPAKADDDWPPLVDAGRSRCHYQAHPQFNLPTSEAIGKAVGLTASERWRSPIQRRASSSTSTSRAHRFLICTSRRQPRSRRHRLYS